MYAGRLQPPGSGGGCVVDAQYGSADLTVVVAPSGHRNLIVDITTDGFEYHRGAVAQGIVQGLVEAREGDSRRYAIQGRAQILLDHREQPDCQG